MPTFTVRPGIYLSPTGDPATATQRWHRDGVEIPGATGTSYTTVSPADDGKLIEYVENVSNLAGAAAEQRLTLQALPSLVTSIVTGSQTFMPRRQSGAGTVSKLTWARRVRVDDWFNYGSLIANGGTAWFYREFSNGFIQVPGQASGQSILGFDLTAIQTGFVSILLAVDFLNDGTLGSGIVAKARFAGNGADFSVSATDSGFTSGAKTLGTEFTGQIAPTMQLQGWSYYHEGAALDPDTYWADFFDSANDHQPKQILSAWPAGIEPAFYLPALASAWTTSANQGSRPADFTWFTGDGPVVDV